MKVLVTGAAGRIGSVVVSVLLEYGHEVRAVDRRGPVPQFPVSMPVQSVDLMDPDAARRAVDGVEAVVHLANMGRWCDLDMQLALADNMRMHQNVFCAAVETKVSRILFASSVHAFNGIAPDGSLVPESRPAYLPLDGALPPLPVSAYGMSKQFGEAMLEYLSRQTGVVTVSYRYPWVSALEEVRKVSVQRPRWQSFGFAFLTSQDAAELVQATLAAPLTGWRVLFPAERENLLRRPARQLIEEFYQGVPLRRPLEEIDGLVDLTHIQRDIDWSPSR